MKKSFLYTSLMLVSLLFISCPEPLTDDVVTAALDNLAPTIEIYSPEENSNYLSVVEFSIYAEDDARTEDDGAGDIASISFSVSNDDFRGGLINISSDGQVSKDPDGGPDTIVYDPESGIIEFSISTIEPNILNGFISVTITVTDRNNNSTQESISLFESDGPIADITLVDSYGNAKKYLAQEDIYLSGTVSNSEDDPNSASEIAEIGFTLADTIIGSLIIDKTETYVDSYSADTLSYYNSSTGLYERRIDGYPDESYAGLFTFDPETMEVDASIYIKDNLEGQGSIIMSFTAIDQNDHEIEKNIFISENTIGPDVTPKVINDGVYGYFSTNTGEADLVTGTIVEDSADISEFVFKLTNGTVFTSFYDGADNLAPGVTVDDAGNSFEIDITSHLSILTADDDYDTDTPTYIDIEVVGSNGVSTSLRRLLYEDSEAPEIDDYSIVSNHSIEAYNSYSNETHNLTIDFSASDNVADVDSDQVFIDVYIGSVSDTLSGVGDHSFTALASDNWSSSVASDENVPVKIVIKDRLSNESIYCNESHPDSGSADVILPENVMYYSGAPAVVTSGSLGANGVSATVYSSDGPNSEYGNDAASFHLSVSSGRKLQIPNVVVGTASAAEMTGAVGDTSFTYVQSLSALSSHLSDEAQIPFTASISDMAGNIATIDEENSYDSSFVIYDNTAPDLSNFSIDLVGGAGAGSAYLNADSSDLNTYIQLVNTDGELTLLDENFRGYQFSYSTAFSGLASDDLNDTTAPYTIPYTTFIPDAVEGSSHTLRIRVYDLAGNYTDEDSTVSFTLDTVAPNITATSFTNIDGTNSEYAKDSETIRLMLTHDADSSGIDLTNSSVSIGSDEGIVSSIISTTSIQFDYETIPYDSGNPLEPYDESDENITFDVTLKDKAGNSASPITSVSSGLAVMYYSGAPAVVTSGSLGANGVSATVYSSDGPNSEYGNDAASFHLSMSSGRKLQIPNVVVGTASAAEMTGTAGDTSFTYVQSLSALSSYLSDEAQIPFTASISDMAGNIATIDEENSYDSSFVIYDNTAPDLSNFSIDLVGGAGAGSAYLNADSSDLNTYIQLVNTDGELTLLDENFRGYQFSYSTAFSGLASDDLNDTTAPYTIPYTTFIPDAVEGSSHTLRIRVYDLAGNYTDEDSTVSFTLDTVAPNITATSFTNIDGTNSEYAKDSETIQLMLTHDADSSGIDLTNSSVSIGSDEGIVSSIISTTSIQFDYETIPYDSGNPLEPYDESDENITFDVTLKDKAGNSASPITSVSSGLAVMFYSGAPAVVTSGSLGANGVSATVYSSDGPNSEYGNDAATFHLSVSSGRKLQIPNVVVGTASAAEMTGTAGDTSFTYVQSLSALSSHLSDEAQIPFTASISDMAGNIATINQENSYDSSFVIYDNTAPDLSNFSIDLVGGAGAGSAYLNADSSDLNTYIQLVNTDGELTLLDENYRGYQFSYSTAFSGLASDDLNDTTAPYTIPYTTFIPDAVEGSSHTLRIRVYDLAGNYTDEDSTVSFTLDTVAPTIHASGNSESTVLTIDTTDIGSPALEEIALTNGPSNVEGGTAGNTTYTIDTATTFTVGTTYEFTAPIVTDDAGNSSNNSFDIVYGTGSDLVVSGLSTTLTTIQPLVSSNQTGTSSFKSISTYDDSEFRRYSKVIESLQTSSVSQTYDTQVSKSIVSSDSERSRLSIRPVLTTKFVKSNAIPSRPVKEREMEDFDISDEVLAEAMAQVEMNQAEYQASVQKILGPELSRAELKELNIRMEPVIVTAEVITVSTTPFLMGTSTQVDVILSDSSENHEDPFQYLGLQILGWFLAGLLTTGFILLMKKMSGT
ncbi:hypothetical protein EXM22_11605 [Oceanispirochaeta crateris]|uniref:Ig-like domain-containing protein n=1 Tax=Oceanispirochaeta crateris TaxID=2518645 RepID=A0A5C1QMZ1_9SPIO|nr:Ig-like domain repeat protein [Oceanispirochaeta crateris]QEN08599.1 hypothetical protein EXM22_11605 [Oceanispirochaeta crateris]